MALAAQDQRPDDDLLWGLRAAVMTIIVNPSNHDLTLRQLGALVMARLERTPTVTYLANRLGVSQPTITRTLDTLEDLGLGRRVRRRPNRRRVLFEPTPEGHAFLDRLAASWRDELNE